jgi:hypothetical protein
MSNPIPTAARKAAQERSMGRCEACGGRARELHHRRSRRVSDRHTHCLCVLVHLCSTCHAKAHQHPEVGKLWGLVVTQWAQEPSEHPFQHHSLGWVRPTCDGSFVATVATGEEQ